MRLPRRGLIVALVIAVATAAGLKMFNCGGLLALVTAGAARCAGTMRYPDGGGLVSSTPSRVSRATANSCFLTARMRRIPLTSMSSTAIRKTTAARAASGR